MFQSFHKGESWDSHLFKVVGNDILRYMLWEITLALWFWEGWWQQWHGFSLFLNPSIKINKATGIAKPTDKPSDNYQGQGPLMILKVWVSGTSHLLRSAFRLGQVESRSQVVLMALRSAEPPNHHWQLLESMTSQSVLTAKPGADSAGSNGTGGAGLSDPPRCWGI